MRMRVKETRRTRNNRFIQGLLGRLALWALVAATPSAARADDPGAVLRRYLRARMQGELDTARACWDGRDVRRSGAMGIRFTDIEAAYDDYWMLSAEERRAGAARATVSVRDSVIDGDHAFFTVTLDASEPAARDTLRYYLRQGDATWQLSLPYTYATRGWTRREGRFVRLRAKRLIHVSSAGLSAMDEAIESALHELKAPEAAILRLERIKLEYYLCDTEDDVRMLVGSPRRAGYLPAGHRIVTRVPSDLNAVVRALVQLTLRETPLAYAPLFDAGLAAALGGTSDVIGKVYLQRARHLVANDAAVLQQPLDTVQLDPKIGVPVAALWSRALLDQLEPEPFAALLRATGGTRSQVAALETETVRNALQAATGKGRREMTQDVQDHFAEMRPSLLPGCAEWPADIRGLNPILQWRNGTEEWGLMGYTIGGDYVFTIAAYVPGPPPWMRDLVDSLQAEHADNSMAWVAPSKGANPKLVGAPPEVVLQVRAKLQEDVEAYESALFAKHYLVQNYKNELFGMFISPDFVRLFDYSQNKLVAEFSVSGDPAGDLPFYDSELQRICFRFPISLMPRPLTSYYVSLNEYTGE